MEEVGVDDGEADEREHHHAVTQGDATQLNKVRIGGEGAHHRARNEAGNHTARQTDGHADPHGQSVNVFESVSVARSVVVSGDRLHTLTNAYNHENQEVTVCVADTVSAHRVVATITQQLTVEDGNHSGSGQVHQERTHTYHGDILEDILPFLLL